MPEDIIAAIVAYLQGAMQGDLQVSPTNQGVWADYARQTIDGVPYAVVHDGPESYLFESDSLMCKVVSDGFCFVAFIAPTKELARALGRKCVRVLVDTVATLTCADGTVLHLRPIKAESVLVTDIGVAVPTSFKRVVTIEYRQEWPSP